MLLCCLQNAFINVAIDLKNGAVNSSRIDKEN